MTIEKLIIKKVSRLYEEKKTFERFNSDELMQVLYDILCLCK